MSIIKSKDEVIKLEKAAKLGESCFDYVLGFLKPGMTEIEVSNRIYDFFMNQSAKCQFQYTKQQFFVYNSHTIYFIYLKSIVKEKIFITRETVKKNCLLIAK